MSNVTDKQSNDTLAKQRRQTLALALVIAVGFICIFAVSHWIESNRPQADARAEEERLYVTGNAARRMSLGFNGLVADWYWMRSLQYVGRKVINHKGQIQLDDLRALDMRLLYPLLDTTTTLDPQFMTAYEFGAVVLPAVNEDEAIKLLQKGIAANPNAWRLYQHLGYIYWQRGEFQMAGEMYGKGAQLQGAPAWMKAMSARMAAEGGSRDTAREMYTRMYEQADDENVRQVAQLRLMQIQSFDERDAIRKVIMDFKTRTGRCPSSWKEITQPLVLAHLRVEATTGAPVDPAGSFYRLVQNGCDVDLDTLSKVPYK